MKLLEFSDNGRSMSAVMFESIEEGAVYNATHTEHTDEEYDFWDYYMRQRVGLEDEEVFYYFDGWEEVPEVGEKFELDGTVYERVE